jgi:thiol-disulfide isomerase/thioredoxin
MTIRSFSILITVLFLYAASLAGGLVGSKAPDIYVRQWVTQNPPSISNPGGKVYVLEFWATWCSPCVANIGHLNKLNNKYKDKGLVLIGMSEDRLSKAKLANFIAQKGINYNIALDNGTANWYGVKGYPTAVVIDSSGIVVWKGHPSSKAFETAIEKALKSVGPSLVVGVDLGSFSYLKNDFWGGANFASAYGIIEKSMYDTSNPDLSSQAARIIVAIDNRLNARISHAQKMASIDRQKAYTIYKDIFAGYGGIGVVERARGDFMRLSRELKGTNVRANITAAVEIK